MPRPRLLRSRKMGISSSQPAPAADEIQSSQPTVPETPTTTRTEDKTTRQSPQPTAASPEIPATNGSVNQSNGDSSKPTKRKRDSEPERKSKVKRKSTSNKQTEDDVDQEPSEPVAVQEEIPATPSQPTPSKSARSKAKRADKMEITKTAPSTPSAPTLSNNGGKYRTLAPATEKPAGSFTPDRSFTPGGTKSVRGSRTREADSMKIGFYTPEEVQKLETFKIDFCTMHGLSASTFDEMIQHSGRRGGGDFPVVADVTSKVDFWNEIYGLLPDRDRRSVYRFMRRHFQASTQKAHEWTDEQDDELVDLIDEHGPKWSYIGKLLGRSDDDVTQRWKNKLEHRNTMNQGSWSAEETRAFFDVMESSWELTNTLQGKNTPQKKKTGKDMYDWEDGSVSWGEISKAIGYKRSRQQCADKWRKIVKQVKTMRANGIPDAVFDVEAAIKPPGQRSGRSASAKSSEFVREDDEEDDNGQQNGKPRPKKGSQAAKSSQPAPRSESESDGELPQPPSTTKKPKKSKSKSKRKHVDETASDNHARSDRRTESDADDEPALPSPPKPTKEERQKAKEALRAKQLQERRKSKADAEAEAETAEQDSRKEAKRLKKTPISEEPKKAKKASKQSQVTETSSGSNSGQSDEHPSPSSPGSNPPKVLNESESSEGEDDSDTETGADNVDIKHEYDSGELSEEL